MLVPIKILLDEAKKPFVPYVTTNSVLVQDTDKTLQDELDNMYTKEETNELVNTGDANTLSSAKSYTDEVVNTGNTNTLNAAKEYTDEAVRTGDANTLNSAKEYTDDALANFEGGITEQQVDEKINTAKSDLTSAYTAADTNTLNSARSYTDSKFNDAGSVVVNPIATIKEELTLQFYGQSVRLYNSALEDISDGKMFTVTFPKSSTSYTYLELYYKYRNSSGTGWRITNVQDYSLLSGQTCIVQARMGASDYTFTVVDVLTSTESVKKNLKDVLVTTCEATNQQYVGQTYYVYDEALRNPAHNQLFIITIPVLPAADKYVRFWYQNQGGSMSGYLLTNAKSNDISNQKILIQAKITGDTTTFELVSILPTKELISNKISDLLITNCGTGGLDRSGNTYYVYSEAFGVPVDKQLFTIQMPSLPASEYYVRFYNRSQNSSYTGWLLNGVKAVDVSNQRLLVQANIVGDVISFDVVSVLPTKEIIVDKISDLLITDCGTGNYNRSGNTYYVYSESFGVPVNKQLFTIQMPELPASEYYVRFYNRNQGSSYTGWLLNGVKALDVSNQHLLVQANVNEDLISFNVIGMLPSKETIVDKISDLLITDCGTGGREQVSTYYYVYSTSFGIPVDKQLFTIQMPELPGSDYTVSFYNRSQNSSYTGWRLKDVKAKDVSNQLLLVQANVVEDVISFSVIAGKKVDTIMNLADVSEHTPMITSTIGTVYNPYISNTYIGGNQYKLSGFFSVQNTSNEGNGTVTIHPLLLPTPSGTPATKLFVLKFDGGSQTIADTPASVTPVFFDWVGTDFVYTDYIPQDDTAYYFIVPQVIKFE